MSPTDPAPDALTARPPDSGAVIDVVYPRLVVEYDPEPETSR